MIFHYRDCEITRVVDGDTIDANIDLAFNLFAKARIRMLGIDAPERGQAGYHKATATLQSLVLGFKVDLIVTGVDSFGRWLAWVVLDDQLIHDVLLNLGLAQKIKSKGEPPKLCDSTCFRILHFDDELEKLHQKGISLRSGLGAPAE